MILLPENTGGGFALALSGWYILDTKTHCIATIWNVLLIFMCSDVSICESFDTKIKVIKLDESKANQMVLVKN